MHATVQVSFGSCNWVMNMAFLGTPLTVEKIFEDYFCRRMGVIRALTQDDEILYNCCDPADTRDLCLYGNPDKTWEVKPPPINIPPSIPDPRLAINVVRDAEGFTDWLIEIALYSDPWLLSVAFYFAARLNSKERERLFYLINDLPTLVQIVGRFQHNKNKTNMASGSISERITRSRYRKVQSKRKLATIAEDDNELCGSCGIDDHIDKFWIACDTCNRWFHGACVYVTAAKAKTIEKYKCPLCNAGGQALD